MKKQCALQLPRVRGPADHRKVLRHCLRHQIHHGANIDAVETAGHLGISADRAVNYHCDSEGTRLNYQALSDAVAAVRCSAPLDEHWKDAIEEDFRRRQGPKR